MSNAPQLLINQITAYFSPLITAKGSDYFQRHQVPNAAGVKILFNERQIEGNHETNKQQNHRSDYIQEKYRLWPHLQMKPITDLTGYKCPPRADRGQTPG